MAIANITNNILTDSGVATSSLLTTSAAAATYQTILTNPVTGTGTTNYLPKFTGASIIGNSAVYDGGGFGGFNSTGLGSRTFVINAANARPLALEMVEYANVHAVYVRPNNSGYNLISSNYISGGVYNPLALSGRENNTDLVLTTSGNVEIGNSAVANLYKLDVNGTGRFSGRLQLNSSTYAVLDMYGASGYGNQIRFGDGTTLKAAIRQNYNIGEGLEFYSGGIALANLALYINPSGNISIGNTNNTYKLDVNGTGRFSGNVGIGGASLTSLWQGQFLQVSSDLILGRLTVNGYSYWGHNVAFNGSAFKSINGGSGALIGLSGAGGFNIDFASGAAAAGDTYPTYATKFALTNAGAATFASSVTATSFFESSSIKGKDIIATNPLLALDIDVIKYTRKSDESKDIRYGYSAEQIHSLMPELTDKDVTAVKYLDVHTILISQLQKEIKELKAKMN
jgi:hypothetical protein